MAEVGVAFLSAILGVVFDKMVSLEVVDFMQGRKLTEGLLRKLKTAVLSVNAVLEDAEEKQLTKPFVRDWIDELKDTLYDAEDILDEIATKALRRKLDAEFQTTAGKDGQMRIIMRVISGSNDSPTNIKKFITIREGNGLADGLGNLGASCGCETTFVDVAWL